MRLSMAGLLDDKHWELLSSHDCAERTLVRELGVSPLVARVLAARGFDDPERAQAFLSPSLERDWDDPLRIPGMYEAANRVEQALKTGEVIAVFGDYDVDGLSAASLLAIGLAELGGKVHAFIPDRFAEGYGLSDAALERVVEACHPQLVVTVDNGIAAAREVEGLLARGIDCVITDHHEPADLVPQGVPVCDPKLDASCASRELAGAGVALKLVCELGHRLGQPNLWRSLTELACLGTVSDMMLLEGENRALVADGIQAMRRSTRPGIAALAAVSDTDLSTITADTLPFTIVPRLNAAGRMGSVDVAFRLLMTNSVEEASVLAGKLEEINNQRRATEAALAEEALEQAEASWADGHVVIAAGEGWHEGVKGIVASRLVSRYHVPAIVFSLVDGEARGSGRSVGSVDLFHAVEQCADFTLRFGGHAGAVGVTVAQDQLPAFKAKLESVLATLPPEQFVTTQEVTALVELGELTMESINSLEALQPFGMGNKKPLFAARGVTMRSRMRVGATGTHLRFIATDGFAQVPAIMFRVPHVEYAVATEGVVDLVFEAINETWQGVTKPKLMVKDILYRSSGSPAGNIQDLIEELPTFPAQEGLSLRGRDASNDELTDQLVHAMIGNHSLLPAQAAALMQLAHGVSTLLVMATGRGKSLVFHVHAAREALLHRRASVFVYPLRALVADQSHHLLDVFGHFGVGARVLCGMTSPEQRVATWEEFADGRCDVLLTTPEFLSLHAAEFAASGRVGFLVIDEAHHLKEATGRRPAYGALLRVREQLGNPCVLAVTATADDEVARSAEHVLGITPDHIVLDEAIRENLTLRDCRELRDRELALASLVARGEKCIIYVNSRDETVSLTRMLRHAVGELADAIAYYNAGMSASHRAAVEAAFRSGQLSCIVSTSAFGEGVNVSDIRNVVLYHLPFGRTEFNQMSGRCGRDGLPANIWLFFSAADAAVNEHLLAAAAPSRDELVALWRALRSVANENGTVYASDAELAELAAHFDVRCVLGEAAVASGLAVFADLGFLTQARQGSGRVISMSAAPQRMSLDESARYAEVSSAAEEFAAFREWVLSASPEELLMSINRPLVPSTALGLCHSEQNDAQALNGDCADESTSVSGR